MEMKIKLQETENKSTKFFFIYDVHIKGKDGKSHIGFRYLNEEKAEETAKLWRKMEEIETAFVITELVFV